MEEEIQWQVVNLTRIGNSYGIILTRKMLKHMNITDDKKVSILMQRDNILSIKNAKRVIPLNLDVSTWEQQMQEAIAAGHLPEPCVWDNSLTTVLEKEWTWHDEYNANGELMPSTEKAPKTNKKKKNNETI